MFAGFAHAHRHGIYCAYLHRNVHSRVKSGPALLPALLPAWTATSDCARLFCKYILCAECLAMLFDFAIADIQQSLVVLTSHLANCIQPATSASGLASVHGDVPSCLRTHRNSTGFQVRCLARDYRPLISPGLWLIRNILKRGQWPSGFEIT